MRSSRLWIAGLAVLSFGAAPVFDAAWARSARGRPLDPYQDQNSDAVAAGVPNIPDQNGCVRWCLQDQSPCDPPVFKQADGRCIFEH